MVGPSTGGPNLRTGPLPLQARKQLRGPQHWRPKPIHWPPSSAGRTTLWWAPSLEAQTNTLAPFLCRPKTTMVGPSTGSPHLHTGPLPLQAENNYGGPQHWKPTSAHWPPSSAGRKSTMVGPITGGPKSTHWPPSSAGRKSSYWPLSSAGRNQHGLAPLCRPKSTTGGPTLQAENNLLLSLHGHGNTTIYPNRTSMPTILTPAPLQWWPPQ